MGYYATIRIKITLKHNLNFVLFSTFFQKRAKFAVKTEL